jgi:putative membrane protein
MMTVLAQLYDHDDHMGWGGWWMLIWSTVLIVALIVLAVWLIRSFTNPPSRPDTPTPDPLDRARSILAERYARGELTTDEYRDRLDHLG